MTVCKLSARKPKDWGLGVTVCIAAMCEVLTKIVTVCDKMITFGDVSIDGTAEKSSPVHPNWFTLYAANDVTDVRPIIETIQLQLCSKKGERFMVEAGHALSMAFAKRHDDIALYRVLRPNGFQSMDDFYAKAKARVIPASEFTRLKRELKAVKPECVVLMGGFDYSGLGHLLLQEAESPYQCYDDPGFWAIGSGQHEALSALFFQADKVGFSQSNSEAECLYHLLAAKFMAESNKLVGKRTFTTVHSFNHSPRHLSEENVAVIRSAWEKAAIPKLPKEIIRRIPKMLSEDAALDRMAEEVFKRRESKKRP
jgi:hypothetical protein